MMLCEASRPGKKKLSLPPSLLYRFATLLVIVKGGNIGVYICAPSQSLSTTTYRPLDVKVI